MRTPQVSVEEILNVLRRRRKYFMIPFVSLVLICVFGAIYLPRKYESTTTIMAQRDEVLNPLVNYTMAVSMASEDRLRTFNEIVYSKVAVQTVIDSLGLAGGTLTESAKEELVKKVKKNIETERPGAQTFRISYLDTDPVRAEQGVSILAHYFIRTILDVENARNELAVEFFEKKLEEMKGKFEVKEKDMVSLLRSRVQEMPLENRTLLDHLDVTDKEIGEIDQRLKDYRRGAELLKSVSGATSDEEYGRKLLELQRTELPHTSELRPLVTKYEEYTRWYTAAYPEVVKLNGQIQDVLTVMNRSLDEEIGREEKARRELDRQRIGNVDNLKEATAVQEMDKDKRSSFDIVRNLYDEMKVKLEQAKTTRDLGRRGGEQFVILDPPAVPSEPSKPNRTLIIGGGVGVGLLLGLFAAALAELLDPTVRTVEDIHMFRKQIVAYIPDGAGEQYS